MHRLDRAGTEIWRTLTAAAPASVDVDSICDALARSHPSTFSAVHSGDVELFLCDLELAGLIQSRSAGATRPSALGAARPSRWLFAAARPSQRLLTGAWELVDEIEPSPRCLARRVGAGFLLRAPDGELSLIAGDAAAIWDSLQRRPLTFVELLDVLGEAGEVDSESAASKLAPLVLGWHDRGVIRGLERVDHLRHHLRSSMSPRLDVGSRTAMACARSVGSSPTSRSGALPSPTRLGSPPVLQDAAGAADHVAIVCQYGIQRLSAGVEPYTQRCIARLRRLDADLVILAGGGRHGASELREAESVIDRYRSLASASARSGWRSTPSPPGRTCSGASRCSRRARSRPGASRSSAIARAPRSSARRAS